MEQYQSLSKEQLLGLCEDLKAQYEGYKAQNLKLDMSRGKPSPEQVERFLCEKVEPILKANPDCLGGKVELSV